MKLGQGKTADALFEAADQIINHGKNVIFVWPHSQNIPYPIHLFLAICDKMGHPYEENWESSANGRLSFTGISHKPWIHFCSSEQFWDESRFRDSWAILILDHRWEEGGDKRCREQWRKIINRFDQQKCKEEKCSTQ